MPVADVPAQPARAHRAPAHRRSTRLDRVERGVIRAVNRARRKRGLPRLRTAPRIAFVAAVHSKDQAVHRFLSHSSSDGTPFYRRIRRVTHARMVGETIVELPGATSGRRAVRAWMHSPPHRTQLLAPGFRRIGVGGARARGATVITADFATGR